VSRRPSPVRSPSPYNLAVIPFRLRSSLSVSFDRSMFGSLRVGTGWRLSYGSSGRSPLWMPCRGLWKAPGSNFLATEKGQASGYATTADAVSTPLPLADQSYGGPFNEKAAACLIDRGSRSSARPLRPPRPSTGPPAQSNPIESAFARVCHRTVRTRGALSASNAAPSLRSGAVKLITRSNGSAWSRTRTSPSPGAPKSGGPVAKP
jgi:hypothetical protein